MEIILLDTQSIRIKGKNATFVVDPTSGMPKTPADAVLLLSTEKTDFPKVEGNRLTIFGAGDYEVGGVKISANGKRDELCYDVRIDGLEILVTKGENLPKLADKTKEYQVIVLETTSPVDQSAVTSHTPRVVLLYGENAEQSAKILDSESAASAQKFQTTFDKLPDEMQVVVLK